MTINGDLNSGDPTGWGIAPATYYKGLRVTSSSAYLNSPPANLTIKVNSPVSRIIFDESKEQSQLRYSQEKSFVQPKISFSLLAH